MKILVTGAAGFIGFYVSQGLRARGDEVVGLDNLNDYCDPCLKASRLEILKRRKNFRFVQLDLVDRGGIDALFMAEKFGRAIHLAGKPIDVFNYGKHKGDFTYVAEIAACVIAAVDHVASPDTGWNSEAPNPSTSRAPHWLYNIGNQRPVGLMRYSEVLKQCLGRRAQLNACGRGCEAIRRMVSFVLSSSDSVVAFHQNDRTHLSDSRLPFGSFLQQHAYHDRLQLCDRGVHDCVFRRRSQLSAQGGASG